MRGFPNERGFLRLIICMSRSRINVDRNDYCINTQIAPIDKLRAESSQGHWELKMYSLYHRKPIDCRVWESSCAITGIGSRTKLCYAGLSNINSFYFHH
jgi:hypothetical protein